MGRLGSSPTIGKFFSVMLHFFVSLSWRKTRVNGFTRIWVQIDDKVLVDRRYGVYEMFLRE